MLSNLPRALKFMFGHEGGYGADPHDRGNWTSGVIGQGELKGTKYGIAAHVYPNEDIRNLTLERAEEIYRRDYAPKVAFAHQPPGVDLTQFDIAVNAGPARANRLQAKAFDVPAGTSPRDLAECAMALADKVPHIKRVNALMLSFYQGLSTFPRYGRGWARRNVEREAMSVKWAIEANGASPSELRDRLNKEASEANKTSNTNAGGAGGTAAGGGAGGTQIDPTTFDYTHWIAAAIVGAIIITIFVYFVWNAYKHKQRAKAYAEVARKDQS